MADTPNMELAEALDRKYPILRKYHPPGFVDFRKGIPPDYVSGLFMKLPEQGEADRLLHFKVKFGSQFPCVSASQVLGHFGIESRVIAPHTFDMEDEGETVKIKDSFWNLEFDLPKDYRV